MSCLWQAWISADGSKKGNDLGMVLNLGIVRSSRAAEGGTGEDPDLALGTSLGTGESHAGTWAHPLGLGLGRAVGSWRLALLQHHWGRG